MNFVKVFTNSGRYNW